jgi:hypothetical protein
MGANPHSRLVPLYRESTTYQTENRPVQGYSGWQHVGKEIPGSRKTVRTDITPADAWDDVSSSEGYENGHSYSGDFGSKHGMHLAGKAPVVKAVVEAVGRLVERLDADELLVAQDDDERAAIAAFGTYAIQTAAEMYGDKWGEAVGFAGIDHVWFGGWCPS